MRRRITPDGSVEVARHDDVSAVLAAGRAAVAHTQTYVSACQKVGYRNPELTGYAGQLIDRYDSEAGLDLSVLDSDCGALGGLADAADDAVRMQREQLTELVGAWRGPGADAAVDFLDRHCDAAAELANRLRAAATGCAELRDELWRLIDTKVTTVLAIDDRVGAARPIWLAAAEAVSAGVAGEPAEIIEKQVIPYVDNDVRGEWLTAVHTARDAALAAYDAAVAGAGAGSDVVFAMPADQLIPRPSRPVVASETVSSSFADPVSGPALIPGRQSPPHAVGDDSPATLHEGLPGALAAPGGLVPPGDMGMPFGGLPGGLPGGGGGLAGLSGLGGLVPRLAEAFGGSGSGDLPADPFDVAGPPDASEEHADPQDHPEGSDFESEESEVSGSTDAASSGEPAAGPTAASVAEESVVQDAPEASDEPDPVSQDPVPTPCEIAAEELPQVGP